MSRYRGFAQVEYDYVRERVYAPFERAAFEKPSPRHRLRLPPGQARVALVATAGAHLPGQPAFDSGPAGDSSYRQLPAGAGELRFAHVGYDTRRALADATAQPKPEDEAGLASYAGSSPVLRPGRAAACWASRMIVSAPVSDAGRSMLLH